MRILLWPVHGSYTDAFVRGGHDYLLPTAAGDEYAPGRGGYDPHWPPNVREIPVADLPCTDVDVVLLQRTEELALATRWLGRTPGRDVPAVFLEHNTPGGPAAGTVHPLADQDAIPVVHVTHFNHTFWDNGRAPSLVVEHGVRDPGPLYTGEIAHLAAVVNEPARRGRPVGADLIGTFTEAGHVDLFGMDAGELPVALGLPADALTAVGDVPTDRMHELLALRRAYVHPFRWTSLGLALLEAMHLGMPVLAYAATEVVRAVPPEAGAVSTDMADLLAAARLMLADPAEARVRGAVAREVALERYGLERFLRDWDTVLADVVTRR